MFFSDTILKVTKDKGVQRGPARSSGVSLTSWGEGASLALVGRPSCDGATIKMPDGVDVLHRPASHPIFSYWAC